MITEQVNKRFMTDAERVKVGFLANVTDKEDFLNIVCAGRVNINGSIAYACGKDRTYNGAFYVTRGGVGEYWINHNFGKYGYWAVGMTQTTPCVTLITLTIVEPNRCRMLIRDFSGVARDDDFTFILFATGF